MLAQSPVYIGYVQYYKTRYQYGFQFNWKNTPANMHRIFSHVPIQDYYTPNRGLLILSDLETQNEANLGSHLSPAWVPNNMAQGHPHHAATRRCLEEIYLCSHFFIHVCWKVYP